MRRYAATAALVAALCGPLPVAAQDQQNQQDLERMVEDALDASDPALAPPLDPADPEALAEDLEAPPPTLFTDSELDELVAPYALYPDALLAQVLVAATFPLEIVHADRLLARSEGMSDDALTAEIEAREWDPSVLVLLTGFPDVIRRMAEDLEDVERLGVAMAEQDLDVLDSVQRLRAQAEATGWLADNEAQVVEREDDRIVIEPADPEVVYVPQYDPALAFTSAPTAAPVIQRPNNPLANPLVAGAIGFGSALLVTELFGDEDNDNDKNGWDDYWSRDRNAIDWRERELYPRAYVWDDPNRRREAAWSRERERRWDRQERRWRAAARDSGRDDGLVWQVRRDPVTGASVLRPVDTGRFNAAIERREARLDRRQERIEDDAERLRRERRAFERAEQRRREAAEERREEQRAEERRAERERRQAEQERERERERERAEQNERPRQQQAGQEEREREQQAERERERQRQAEREREREQQAERERERQQQGERERQRQAEQERERQQQAEQRQRQAERERQQQAERQRQQGQGQQGGGDGGRRCPKGPEGRECRQGG